MPTIGLAVEADLATVRAIARSAFAVYVPSMGREPAPMTIDYEAAIATGSVWMANQLQGFVKLDPNPDHLYIDVLAVDPTYHGRGIGTALLQWAESRAYELKLSELRLCTNQAMTGNLDYYPRRGFVQTHSGDEDGYRRVYFRRTLPPR